CGATLEAAAEKAGLSRSTVHRRLGDPAFRKRLKNLRSEMIERAGAMLTAASMEAVRTLVSLMERATPPATRLGAARATLELGVRLREFGEVEERLAALEKRLLLENGSQSN